MAHILGSKPRSIIYFSVEIASKHTQCTLLVGPTAPLSIKTTLAQGHPSPQGKTGMGKS